MKTMAKDYIGIVTPEGTAIYPHLIKPDTKFNVMGEYKVSLSIPEKEAAPMIVNYNNAQKIAKSMIPKGKNPKMAQLPYSNELDDDGQETGNVIFKFKMKAKVTTLDGRNIELKPKIFDAAGTLLNDVDSIWGGSRLRVSADLVPYHVAAIGAGVSARLKAVQIIELKTGGGSSAEAFGFEATDGFTTEESSAAKDEGFTDEEDF